MFMYVVLGALILLALYNMLAIKGLKKKIAEAKDSIQSQVSWAKEDLRNDITGIRTIMKILAAGGRVTADMIDEGKTFSDMSAIDAEKFLKQTPKVAVIDVRSPGEFAEGHIPGAQLIPIDEIEDRLNEVPKDAQALLVVCQSGTRSAAACEILSKHGFVNLINIYDGTPGWPGKKEIGVTIRPPASAAR